MAEGFLGRWSQRKQAVRAGQPLQEPLAKPPVEPPAQAPSVPTAAQEPAPSPPAAAPLPTLDDVKALHADSSFAPFVSRDVAPEVRNAAMKKLFTDPHYNVMDRLDIYIDDYSLPSPLPAATLRQMASAQFLNLFEEDPPTTDAVAAADVAASANPSLQANKAQDPPQDPSHDHTDLRLQPDPAAEPPRLERQPERTPDPALQPVPPRSC